MLTLAWMIETLCEECALIRPPNKGIHALARQIVSARAKELSAEETGALIDAGREEALAPATPFPADGLLAAAARALQREGGLEPDPDADETDRNGDVKALLNVLALGLARLSRDE